MLLLSMLIKNRMETWRKFQECESVKFVGNAPENVGLEWTFTDLALSWKAPNLSDLKISSKTLWHTNLVLPNHWSKHYVFFLQKDFASPEWDPDQAMIIPATWRPRGITCHFAKTNQIQLCFRRGGPGSISTGERWVAEFCRVFLLVYSEERRGTTRTATTQL